MAKQTAVPTARRWTPPNHDGIDDGQVVDVDLDETDLSKSVQVGRSEGKPPPTRGRPAAGADEDDNDYVLKQRKIQQRLTRERLATERRVRQETANESAALQRQLSAKDEEIARLRTKRHEAPNDAAHQTLMDSLQAQLEAAWEKGDSKEAARIQRSMTEKQSEHESKKLAALLGNTPTQQQQQRPAQQQAAAAADTASGLRPEGRRWLVANPWFNDPAYAIERDMVTSIDNELMSRGSDPNDPLHYERIAKVAKSKMPSLGNIIRSPDDEGAVADSLLDGLVDDDTLDEDREQNERIRQAAQSGRRQREVADDDLDDDKGRKQQQKRERAPVLNSGDETRDQNSRGGRRREQITAEEIREMQKFGLDVTDPKVATAYVRERRLQEERDAR